MGEIKIHRPNFIINFVNKILSFFDKSNTIYTFEELMGKVLIPEKRKRLTAKQIQKVLSYISENLDEEKNTTLKNI